MRLAVLSDIHANLEALEAVCRAGDERGVEAWICLGDVVGYGADPRACLERVRTLTGDTVLGNHDAAAVGLLDTGHFNPDARQAASWTSEQLGPEEQRYLADLPLALERDGALFVHADPLDPGGWDYILSRDDAREALSATENRLCFIGHSHYPFVCSLRNGEAQMAAPGEGPVDLDAEARYLINVGSVGQPRDGDPRACFVFWDPQAPALEFVRNVYDVGSAQAKIVAAGLPGYLAERLAVGH